MRYTVTLTVQVNNFDMTQSTALGNAPGKGRILYSMDPTGAAPPAGGVISSDTVSVFSNVTPGVHTFRAELINADGTAFTPPKYAQVTIVLP